MRRGNKSVGLFFSSLTHARKKLRYRPDLIECRSNQGFVGQYASFRLLQQLKLPFHRRRNLLFMLP
jgi:hypothetical protein